MCCASFPSSLSFFFFFNDTATTEIYTLSLHDALPIFKGQLFRSDFVIIKRKITHAPGRSEEHTSELQSPQNLVCRLLLEKKKNEDALGRALGGAWAHGVAHAAARVSLASSRPPHMLVPTAQPPMALHLFFFFFNDTATTEIYTLSLHDALPILSVPGAAAGRRRPRRSCPRRRRRDRKSTRLNSSHLRISYAVFCLKQKKTTPAYESVQMVKRACVTQSARHHRR